jgi:hypothetical protein
LSEKKRPTATVSRKTINQTQTKALLCGANIRLFLIQKEFNLIFAKKCLIFRKIKKPLRCAGA